MPNVNVDVTATNVANPQTPISVGLMAVVNPDGSPIAAGGGGGTSNGLTDAQLRASPVPVDGPLTNAQLRATAVSVAGPLTDAQLRAAAVPVSGPITNAQFTAVTGAASAAAWDGAAASATMVAILKALHAQNAAILVQLQAINTNTTPAA